MNAIEHLNKSQITGYYSGVFADGELREIGRHLLRCSICRDLLPSPAFEDFQIALTTERDDLKMAFPRQSVYRSYIQFLQHSRLAWSAAALLVLFTLSFIWLVISRQGTNEVAKSFESKVPVTVPGFNGSEGRESSLPDSNISKPSSVANNEHGTQSGSEKKHDRTLTRQTTNRNLGVALTRGADAKCGTDAALEMELGKVANSFVLKWKEFPQAAKYHVYISDDDEILIDEFETTKQTYYILNKPLDPNKSYRWKIVITLENGQTISADSKRFTSKDFQSSQNMLHTKRKAEVRCSERQ